MTLTQTQEGQLPLLLELAAVIGTYEKPEDNILVSEGPCAFVYNPDSTSHLYDEHSLLVLDEKQWEQLKKFEQAVMTTYGGLYPRTEYTFDIVGFAVTNKLLLDLEYQGDEDSDNERITVDAEGKKKTYHKGWVEDTPRDESHS